jgi:hypothetical protein
MKTDSSNFARAGADLKEISFKITPTTDFLRISAHELPFEDKNSIWIVVTRTKP